MAATTFVAPAERIALSHWTQGLTGSFPTDLVAELCVGEKCLN
jgi:hypothetical protein